VETARDEHAARIILHGEIELRTVEALEAAFTSIELDGQRTVQIEVSDLDFVDAAALRRLAALAMRLRQGGYDVTTRGARPVLQRMARVLELSDELGLS
jgi:anti-anti-sigma factor